MRSRYMKPLKWACRKEESEYIRLRHRQNTERSLSNPNENWMFEKLQKTGFKWKRSALWGFRIFDFWCHSLGVAVEVDGPEHKIGYDNYRDEYNYRRSGILVLRVRNKNEEDAAGALRVISESETWAQRRDRLGINRPSKAARRSLVSGKQKHVKVAA